MSPELRYHNILVTLDGSPEAETALPHAMAIAAQFNATVTLLRVADAPTGWFVSPTDAVPLIEMEREASVDYLESLARYWANGAPAIRVAHQAGAAAESIVQYARSTAADLVVMSTRGRGGIARLLLGSVAHAVQRKAPCPILLVPSSARPRGERHAEYGRVLLALDGSSEAELAVAHALALARRFHAAVTVVRPVVSAVAVGTSHGPGLTREFSWPTSGYGRRLPRRHSRSLPRTWGSGRPGDTPRARRRWAGSASPRLEPTLETLVGAFAPTASHGMAIGVSFAIITALHIVIGELAPKRLALHRRSTRARRIGAT